MRAWRNSAMICTKSRGSASSSFRLRQAKLPCWKIAGGGHWRRVWRSWKDCDRRKRAKLGATGRFVIANCKLKIEKCKLDDPVAQSRLILQTICNFHFSICNSDFLRSSLEHV